MKHWERNTDPVEYPSFLKPKMIVLYFTIKIFQELNKIKYDFGGIPGSSTCVTKIIAIKIEKPEIKMR